VKLEVAEDRVMNRQMLSKRWLPIPGLVALAYLVLILAGSTLVPTRLQAADTLFVDNSKSCPGGPGTTTSNAYCNITNALNSFSGGTNKVIAVVGTATPYKEQVKVSPSDSGSTSQPLVLLQYSGTATLEGADTNSVWVPRYNESGVKLWAAKVTGTLSCRQVILNDIRYPEWGADSSIVNIPSGKCHYDDVLDTVFVYFPDPSHNYLGDLAYHCVRNPIIIAASNVIVDGFTIRRAKFDGVQVDSTAAGDPSMVRNVTIRNCTIEQGGESGVDFNRALQSSIIGNTCRNNTSHGIFLKSRPNEATQAVADCIVRNNVCYSNDNQSVDRGGTNGIRIGNFRGPTTGHHIVEGNQTYLNEDSGIELNLSDANLLRNNQSWLNLDHGFDHIGADSTRHIGDLAFGNDRDGISVERTSLYTSLRNCVLSDNGRALNRQDYELEAIGAARDSFKSNYNVMYRPTRSATACGGSWSEGADSILVSWRAKDTQNDSCQARCSYADSCFGTLARFASAAVNPLNNESNSKQGDPLFASTSTPSFRPFWSSPGVEAADTSVTSWPATDAGGFARKDLSGKTNAGKPAGAYADIGPYEYDDAMSPVDSVAGAYNSVSISWTATGRYGNTSYKPLWYKIYVDGVLKRTRIAANMSSWPGTVTETGLSASSCSSHDVYVTTLAESTSASHKDITQSNTVSVTTCCSPGCSDSPDLSSRGPREEGVNFPPALEWTGANPSRGIGVVNWSIPTAQAGAAYDLSLFDVAGRRVSTITRGVAKPGKYAEDMTFRATDGRALPNGVFFLRLRVGGEILHRTVVLTR
jgi:parallel beta helix pectate lyase-like protein